MKKTYRMRKRKKSKNSTEQNYQVTDVIKHIGEFKKHYRKKLLCIPYMRESTYKQLKEGHLKQRKRRLLYSLKKRRIEHHKCFTEVVSGTKLHNRHSLEEAIKLANTLAYKYPNRIVVVVTDTRNRFIRGANYNGTADSDLPNNRQLRTLMKMKGNVILATGLRPDAPFDVVQSYQTKLGKKTKGHCGRPPKAVPGAKKERRDKLKPIAIQLRKDGKSLRQIEKILGVRFTTVGDWVK